ncbi:hypothetical protein LSH36_437g01034 [Paralvinella palmiformis]|uniref:Dymeclin n=1 Tax=Paralvinella palmiformis TaxID=53620 RepID=A0AAD9JBH5_9ANNE|nr:hypothetical protein LSH36_437g01034 [Paralvinella palmiformis]
MGASSSSLSELPDNVYLKRLASKEVISANDPFWNQLLSYTFHIPRNSSDQRLLEESTTILCKNFAINNCTTGNFGSLIQVFLLRASAVRASPLCDDNVMVWQMYNAMFIIRNLCKYFIENLSEEVVIQQFETRPPTNDDKLDTSDTSQLDELMNALMELFYDLPLLNFTYVIHLECLNTLLILLSMQIFHVNSSDQSTIYETIMQGKCAIHSCLFMKTLIERYIEQAKCPPEVLSNNGNSHGFYSITAAVASGVWNVLTLGMGSKTTNSDDQLPDTILANQSLLLLLVLINHCTSDSGIHNPYREALFSFTNSQEDAEVTVPTKACATFKVDMSKLYETLCATLKDDEVTLLLYLLLHRNADMKSFILSRTNIDQLMLKNVLWFKERQISEISLGGLLILVVVRTMQYNMTRMRDKYLHTNCLAALANMSSQFQNLHPYVTQRIVSLFSLLLKKHTRLVEQIRITALESGRNSESGSDTEPQPDYIQDLSVVEEVIRMLLEIINSCLTHSLHHNPNLIYTLLYQKDIFAHFRTHPTFQDIIQNIDTVLNFFTARVESLDKSVSVQEVVEVIKQGAVQFRRDRLKKFPELKFRYVEEEQPEEFFVPYVWSLVYHSSHLYFNAARIQLFTLES